jgi:hypothetical protein
MVPGVMDRPVVGDVAMAGCPAESIVSVVARLRSSADTLHRCLPEMVDGESWARVNAALAALHGALIELEELEGATPDRPGAPVAPA